MDGHGTGMAGLIAAHGHNEGRDGILGIAPQAKIFPVRLGVHSGGNDEARLAAGIPVEDQVLAKDSELERVLGARNHGSAPTAQVCTRLNG